MARQSDRVTLRVDVSTGLRERLLDAADWRRETLTAFFDRAAEAEVAALEAAHGRKFRRRANDLLRGRRSGARPDGSVDAAQTFHVRRDLLDRCRDAAYALRTMASALFVDAVEHELARLEEANGGPFPPRAAPPRPGRRPS